jgi:hypothetical protein
MIRVKPLANRAFAAPPASGFRLVENRVFCETDLHMRGPLEQWLSKAESEFAERCWAESAPRTRPWPPHQGHYLDTGISKLQIQRTTREQRLPIGTVPRIASGSPLLADPLHLEDHGHVKVSRNAFEGDSPRRAIRVHVCAATRMALLVEDRVPLTKDGASTLRGSQNS